MSTVGPRPETSLDPLDDKLRKRVERAVGAARASLGMSAEPDCTVDVSALGALRAALGERVNPEVAAGHDAALEGLRRRHERRFEALDRVQAGIAHLRALTAPSAILASAPGELCARSTFARVVLSLIRDGRMMAEAAYFRDDEASARAALASLRAEPARLEHPLVETELLRRRQATIVTEAQAHPRVHQPTARTMAWSSYVAAPLTVNSHVIGVLHADNGSDTALDALDRDVLWEFACGLAQVYETADLRRILQHERAQTRAFLEWLNARSGELADARVTVGEQAGPALPPPEPMEEGAPPRGRDDRIVFDGLLTRRELEVLRLLAEGRTNAAIAAELVISPGTVKFHVSSILRKLRVANRAEAVLRYLALLGARTP